MQPGAPRRLEQHETKARDRTMIELTERAKTALNNLLEEKPGSALRLFIEGYG